MIHFEMEVETSVKEYSSWSLDAEIRSGNVGNGDSQNKGLVNRIQL